MDRIVLGLWAPRVHSRGVQGSALIVGMGVKKEGQPRICLGVARRRGPTWPPHMVY